MSTTTAPTTRVSNGSAGLFFDTDGWFRAHADKISTGYYVSIHSDSIQWLSPVFGDARELLERVSKIRKFESGRVVISGIGNVDSVFLTPEQHQQVVEAVRQQVERCPVQQPEGVSYIRKW